jgi:hypothetical protein
MNTAEIERRTQQVLAWTAMSPCCWYFTCPNCSEIVMILSALRQTVGLPASRQWWELRWEEAKEI